MHAPIIFDGQGRLFSERSNVIVDRDGVRVGDDQLFRVSRHDFELIRELGNGQYGTVWAVKHLPTKTIMAIKIVTLSVSESALKQILTELDILIRADSPFIVRCFGAFCSEASVYFCMELMEEGPINVVFESRRHSSEPSEREEFLRAVAYNVICGLEFLRDSFSVIHRDIKPCNILIGKEGDIKICDFGVSGYLVQSLARTRIGTSNYMAPERISLGGSELGGGGYGIKADVWSLGASLMELSTGSPPFPLSNYDCIFAQLMDIISGDVPKMPRDGTVSDALADFVDACLRKGPDDRPNYMMLLEHPFLEGMSLERSRSVVLHWLSLNTL